MPVECHFFGPLREALGTKTVEQQIQDDATVSDVVEALIEEYPALAEGLIDEDGRLRESVNVTLNKENINHLDGAETTLDNGDVLRFAAAVIGGSKTRAASRAR